MKCMLTLLLIIGAAAATQVPELDDDASALIQVGKPFGRKHHHKASGEEARFHVYPGFLLQGHDIATVDGGGDGKLTVDMNVKGPDENPAQWLTMDVAKTMCFQSPMCKGFSFRAKGTVRPNTNVWIWFKTSKEMDQNTEKKAGAGWVSMVKNSKAKMATQAIHKPAESALSKVAGGLSQLVWGKDSEEAKMARWEAAKKQQWASKGWTIKDTDWQKKALDPVINEERKAKEAAEKEAAAKFAVKEFGEHKEIQQEVQVEADALKARELATKAAEEAKVAKEAAQEEWQKMRVEGQKRGRRAAAEKAREEAAAAKVEHIQEQTKVLKKAEEVKAVQEVKAEKVKAVEEVKAVEKVVAATAEIKPAELKQAGSSLAETKKAQAEAKATKQAEQKANAEAAKAAAKAKFEEAKAAKEKVKADAKAAKEKAEADEKAAAAAKAVADAKAQAVADAKKAVEDAKIAKAQAQTDAKAKADESKKAAAEAKIKKQADDKAKFEEAKAARVAAKAETDAADAARDAKAKAMADDFAKEAPKAAKEAPKADAKAAKEAPKAAKESPKADAKAAKEAPKAEAKAAKEAPKVPPAPAAVAVAAPKAAVAAPKAEASTQKKKENKVSAQALHDAAKAEFQARQRV